MTGYRLRSSALSGPSIARERADGWDAAGGDRPVDALTGRLSRLVEDLAGEDVRRLGGDATRERLDVLRRLEGAVVAATVRTVHHHAATGGVRDDGATSTSAWLREHGNRTQHDAARLARLSSMADQLPRTLAAVASGDVTLPAADTIVGAVKDERLGTAAEVEDLLLPVATNESPSTLRRQVEQQTQRRDGDAMLTDEHRQHAARRVALTERPDGLWSLAGLLPHETALKAKTAFDALMTKDPEDTPDDQRRTFVQRTADAFTDLVDLGLDHGDLPSSAGQSRPHLVLITDTDTVDVDLTDDTGHGPVPTDSPVWSDLPGGIADWSDRPLSPQAVRRFACDASTTRADLDGQQPLALGRRTPSWTGPQRTAIRVRDGQCRGPGCIRPIAWTQIHHVRWWRNGGTTDLSNGVALCHHCHHKVHDLGWQLTLDPNSADVTWTAPDGRIIVTRPRELPGRKRRTA